MKIAFVSIMSAFPWGGSEELWAKTVLCALNEGHQVLISVLEWSVEQPAVRALLDRGAVLHVRPRQRKAPPASFALRISRRVATYLTGESQKPVSHYVGVEAFNPDVLCVSQGGTFDLVYDSFLLQLLERFKYCLLCHHNHEVGVLPYARLATARKVFRRAQQVFFVADRNRRTAERQLAQAFSNAAIVRNPLNVEGTTLVPFPQGCTCSFACVARLDCNSKGQDIIFQLLSQPHWKDRTWQLNLYGKGPDEAYLRELAAFYGLTNRIHFRGHVDNIRQVWVDNHIQLMPSINEGTPLALIEAMFCGRPAVVTDVGGNAEMITEGITGFIAEAPSIQSFGNALERAWQQADRWEVYGANAHRFVKAHIDLQSDKTLLDLLLKNT